MTVMETGALGLPYGRELTRADLDALPDDGHRYELLDGALIVSPSPRHSHQRVCAGLFRRLDRVVPPELELLFAPFDVVLATDTVIQPDLLVARREDFTERDLPVAPVLAVEVLSPSTRSIDLLLKKERLERAGCPHYWVIDPDAPSITAWALADGHYGAPTRVVGAERFEFSGPLNFSVSPNELGDDSR